MSNLPLIAVDMDEYVIIDRRREVNVWVHEGDVHLAVEDIDGRSQIVLNLVQAEKVATLLTQAVACVKAKD
jgi:hypothetical protein